MDGWMTKWSFIWCIALLHKKLLLFSSGRRPKKYLKLTKSILILLNIDTRGPKGQLSCTWVQCATLLTDWPGRPSCLSDLSKKHTLGRGCWDLASYQVSLNSVHPFQRRNWKCLSQLEVGVAILFFPIGTKNTNLVENVEILLTVKFRWIPFSCFRVEVKNVLANQSPGQPSHFYDQPEKHKLYRGRWDLASCQVSLSIVLRFKRSPKCLSQSEARVAILLFWSPRKKQLWSKTLRSWVLSSFLEFRSAILEEKSKMSHPIRGQGSHLVFPIGRKNKSFVEDIEILLPVKFCWIQFSGFRGEIRNVSANQRSRLPSWFFPIGLKNTNLVEDIKILLNVKFR